MVTVYITSTCPFCKMLQEYLKKHDVEFETKNVTEDEAARDEMGHLSGGFLGVPFTVVDKDKDKTVIGFDEKKLNELLGLNK